MSEFKGTPGPWTLVSGYNIFSELGADGGDGYKAPENDGWLIATVELGRVFSEDGEIIELGHGVARANARLIAAAPELLEALAGLMRVEARDRIMPVGAEWDAARAAIAKALGEGHE